jgi:hypothetical protein
MSGEPLGLLNIFEVDEGARKRHLVCFLEPVMAGSQGIEGRCVVGEFTPDGGGEFDVETFAVNPEFLEAFTEYMNAEAIHEPGLIAQARQQESGGWLFLVDPRVELEPNVEPPATELIGCFAIDDAGAIISESFRYNEQHVLFNTQTGISGMLQDRRFYDWLHPVDGR